MTFNFHNTTAFIGHKAALILTRILDRFNADHLENSPFSQSPSDSRPTTPGVYALLAGVSDDLKPH